MSTKEEHATINIRDANKPLLSEFKEIFLEELLDRWTPIQDI